MSHSMTPRSTRLARVLPLTAALLLLAPAALAGGFILEEHGYYIVDFVVLGSILFYFVRGPARQFLEDRHEAVAREMREASALKKDAEERLARYEQMLADLTNEVTRLREEFKADGQREAQRIVAEAEATAERIRRDTTSTVEAELAALREDLEHEVARQALTKAEALIKSQVTADRQKALVRGFIDELETHRDLSSLTA